MQIISIQYIQYTSKYMFFLNTLTATQSLDKDKPWNLLLFKKCTCGVYDPMVTLVNNA